MKLSRFTRLFSREGRYFLYSSLSNAFAELNEETYLCLKRTQSPISSEAIQGNLAGEVPEEEVLRTLRQIKAIDTEDDYEISRIRFRHYAQQFNPQILSLTINPTLGCNFRCGYCFEKDHRNEFMTAETEDLIADYVKQHTSSKLLSVTWFGGEPLLAYKTMRSLTSKLIDLKPEYDAGMITNGYLLTEDICKGLAEMKISRMQITIDGNEDTHNRRRPLHNGGGTFRRIMDNIETAQTVTPEIRICVRVNVDASNSGEFVDIYEYFKRRQYPNVDITPGYTVDIDASGTNSFCRMDDGNIRKFLMDLTDKHGIYNGDFYPQGRGGVCGACKPSSAVVGPRGELYRCWNDVGCKDREYGNINGEIYNPKALYEYLGVEDQFSDKECMECILLPVCSGGCPYQRIMSRKKDSEYTQCPLIKSDLDDFLWLHYLNKKKQLSS